MKKRLPKRFFPVIALLVIALALSSCAKQSVAPAETEATQGETAAPEAAEASQGETAAPEAGEATQGETAVPDENDDAQGKEEEKEDAMSNEIILEIDGERINVKWEESETLESLRELLKDGEVEIQMSKYGGFEQVGSLGFELPRNDVEQTTSVGDIMLYSGDQIVMFYGANTWAYTRLGKIDESDERIAELLGSVNVKIKLSIAGANAKAGEDAQEDVQYVELNSGYNMPILGLGTWTLSNEEAEESTYQALKVGMRLIDTARYYRCEVGVGKGIKRAIDEGICTREDVFVTSKIMPSDYTRAYQGIQDSLSDLDLDYVDLMLIHQPGSNDREVYKAMEQAVEDGMVRSIGISNYYTREAVDEVLSYAEITPAVIQNENHIYYQNKELQDYVSQYGIVIESWYPFGGRGHTKEHFDNPTIKEIAEKHGKTSAQVILRWHIQAGYITIPGSSNAEHIAENQDVFDFKLTEDEMKQISDLNQNARYESW